MPRLNTTKWLFNPQMLGTGTDAKPHVFMTLLLASYAPKSHRNFRKRFYGGKPNSGAEIWWVALSHFCFQDPLPKVAGIVNSYINKTTCNSGTGHQKYPSRGAVEHRGRRVEVKHAQRDRKSNRGNKQ
jgi:hypothetical protein